ncbi:vacuolar protein sorting-associated protein 37A-like [Liolophura sinensis]|uniref:vacuolar protein sorting-associated protein 37A-like n=1 Tax=Liolophura sinensis TaxID=3198878 RepID=UPI0031598C67
MNFWNIFGGKSNTPSPTYLQAQKTKQIESLRKISASVSETIRDVEYRATFPVNTTNLTLVISLPPKFPQDQPMVGVEPGVHHPWVDNQMRVAHCPALLSFSMHSSLGSAVQSIVDEFKRNPPQVLPQHLYNAGGQLPYPLPSTAYPQPGYSQPDSAQTQYSQDVPLMRTPSLSSYTSQMSTEDSVRDTSGSSLYQMPEIPASFPALKNKSMTELNELMHDEGKMLELLQQQPELEKISEDRRELSRTCEELAKSNLSRKPEVENLKRSLIEQWDRMSEMRSQLEDQVARQALLAEQFHPSILQTNLKVAALEAEEESERIAEAFLDKKMDIDEFKQKYMEIRTLCHSRRAKEEKLHQIIMSQGLQY